MSKRQKKEIETKEEIVNPEDLLLENEKKAKKGAFWDEFKACIILVVIICSVIAVSCIWYMEIKNKEQADKGQVSVNDENGYKYISYETEDGNSLKVLEDKYVILYDDTSVLKVMDLDLNTIYENEVAFTDYYLDANKDLYFCKEEEIENGNEITLYRLENNDLAEVKKLSQANTYFRPIYLDIDNKETILGYDGISTRENEEDDFKEYIYLLNGKEYELKNISLVSDYSQLAVTDPIYLQNNKYAIYINEAGKYGVYNVVDNAKVIDASYDVLYRDKNNNNFVAIKNNKAGIIDSSLRKIVDYNYDFIDVNDGYYIVGKNDKLALMDDKYKLVTNFVFDFQDNEDNGYLYHECCGNYNTFTSYHLNDKYLLVTNVNESEEAVKYNKNEAYLIDSTGKYETIPENKIEVDFSNNIIWLYNSDNKEYTFYDLDFKELYKINFKDYDYDQEPTFKISYGTLSTNFLNSNLYYNIKTGEKLDKALDYEEKILDDIVFKMNGENQETKVYLKDKEIFKYKYNNDEENEDNKLFTQIADDRVIYADNHTYFTIRKDE